MSKKQLGQFYTTNYDHIIDGMEIPEEVKIIIEPFAGQGDLVEFAKKACSGDDESNDVIFECYDIDPKADYIVQRDTIKNPPDYEGKFVLTNPPYLARNKASDKTLFDKYKTDDLYKCFLEELVKTPSVKTPSGAPPVGPPVGPSGGIIIVPLNFWSSIRVKDVGLRRRFLERFSVIRLNIFEEQVFSDTTYTVCSFLFKQREKDDRPTISVKIFPSKKEFDVALDKSTNYTFGGEMYRLPQNSDMKIDRLTRKNMDKEDCITDILVKCIDDNRKSMIGLSIVEPEKRYLDDTKNLSARSYATLVIDPPISKIKQKKLVKKFNDFMKEKREQYNSLFLTNYRESKDMARKRISFSLVYQITNFLLHQS
jgi:hypothetical protein